MGDRPPLPAELKRQILVEAGHRCAIPTCRHPTTEIAHIEPWSKVKKHEYSNLIALCPNCHTRAEKGQIDKKSLNTYKRILQRLTDKFDRFELNVLSELREKRMVLIPASMILLIKNLLDEKLIRLQGMGVHFDEMPKFEKMSFIGIHDEKLTLSDYEGAWEFKPSSTFLVFLSDGGRGFIGEWIKANEKLTY